MNEACMIILLSYSLLLLSLYSPAILGHDGHMMQRVSWEGSTTDLIGEDALEMQPVGLVDRPTTTTTLEWGRRRRRRSNCVCFCRLSSVILRINRVELVFVPCLLLLSLSVL